MELKPYTKIRFKPNDKLAYFESSDPDEIAKMEAALRESGLTDDLLFIEADNGAKVTYFPKAWLEFNGEPIADDDEQVEDDVPTE